MTANQMVAANLRRARKLRGWTQPEAAEQLERYLGERWSAATFSAAERSVDGKRIRHFSADELVAFARAFDLPVTFFLTPWAPCPHCDGTGALLQEPEEMAAQVTARAADTGACLPSLLPSEDAVLDVSKRTTFDLAMEMAKLADA